MYGSFLRQVRTSRRLSQAQLAEIVGIEQPNLSAYERDRRVPSLDVVNKILVACGYQLTAAGITTSIGCPLPRTGWFADDDNPPPLPDDPIDDPPVFGPDTPDDVRGRALEQVLHLASQFS